MKFTLIFKTPDVLDQLDELSSEEKEEALEFAKLFITYGEYITIHFDTIKGTAKCSGSE